MMKVYNIYIYRNDSAVYVHYIVNYVVRQLMKGRNAAPMSDDGGKKCLNFYISVREVSLKRRKKNACVTHAFEIQNVFED